MNTNGKPEQVGQRLRRLRLAKGFSQRDLSSPGVSYAYISRIEAGARTPSVKALRKLAARLGVTVEYLETGSDRSLVDDLVHELFVRTRSPVRMSALPLRAFVRWKSGDVEFTATGMNLTEALLDAVGRMRERDEIRWEQERLERRAASLRR